VADHRLRVPRWTLLSIVATSAIGATSWLAVLASTDAPTRAADEFLEALVDGRHDDAYADLCEADRSERSADEFAHAVSDLSRGLRGHDAFTLDPTGDTRTVHFTLDYGSRTDEFDLDVVEANGTWHVCHFLTEVPR
jgi:hypothetical protein